MKRERKRVSESESENVCVCVCTRTLGRAKFMNVSVCRCFTMNTFACVEFYIYANAVHCALCT